MSPLMVILVVSGKSFRAGMSVFKNYGIGEYALSNIFINNNKLFFNIKLPGTGSRCE
ncbi:hypothetical protein ACOHYD_02075 [Desulfobacterota bacterium M19]